jgi:hypothetical protein
VSGQVDVEQKVVFHFLQQSQTFAVLGLVETENNLKQNDCGLVKKYRNTF